MTFRIPRISPILFIAVLLAATGVSRVQAQISPVAGENIRIVLPTDGEVFVAPADIAATVEGQDMPDVGHVIELFNGNERVGVVVLDPLIPIRTMPVSFEFTFMVNNLKPGDYTLTAQIDLIRSEPVHVVVRKRHRHRKAEADDT